MKIFIFFSVLIAIVYGQGNAWCNRQSLREAFDAAFDLNVKNPSISTSSRGGSRIVGGQNAARGQFGFFVMVESFDGRWQTPCGGALIRFNWVLTAGQCIVCARSVTATFGQVDRNGGPISWLTHVSNVDHIKYHSKYNPWDFQNNPFVNDIGLVYLADAQEPILIPFVTLIDFSEDVSNNFYQTQATVMGFGSTQDPANHLSLQLNYVEVQVISNELCNETFIDAIEESNLCTDAATGSVCQGDAGGPLVARDASDHWVLIGVTSFRHRDGCTLGHPSVFTRVTSHIDWIHSIISQLLSPPEPEPIPYEEVKCNCHCHIT